MFFLTVLDDIFITFVSAIEILFACILIPLQSPVRMTCYLEPVEDDAMLLQLYLQALVRGIVR